MNKLKRGLTGIALVLTLATVGCGTDSAPGGTTAKNNDTTPATSASGLQGARYAALLTDLPACDTAAEGLLFYVGELAQFQVCQSGQFTPIDLTGPAGAGGGQPIVLLPKIDQPVLDNVGVFQFPVILTASAPGVVTVDYASGSDGDGGFSDPAVDINYYVPVSGTLTFAPGETVKYIPITIKQDPLWEPDYEATITIENSNGAYALSDYSVNQSTFTIRSSTPKPSVTIANQSGLAEDSWAPITVTLSAAVDADIIVTLGINPGTASFAYNTVGDICPSGTNTSCYTGYMYDEVFKEIFIPGGQATITIAEGVWVVGDRETEAQETFSLTLAPEVIFDGSTQVFNVLTSFTPGNYTIAANTYTLPQMSIADVSCNEADGGNCAFTVTLDKPLYLPKGGNGICGVDFYNSPTFSICLDIAHGTTDDADFNGATPVQSCVNLSCENNGSTEFSISLSFYDEINVVFANYISEDFDVEADETFSATIATGYDTTYLGLAVGSATGTIVNND